MLKEIQVNCFINVAFSFQKRAADELEQESKNQVVDFDGFYTQVQTLLEEYKHFK